MAAQHKRSWKLRKYMTLPVLCLKLRSSRCSDRETLRIMPNIFFSLIRSKIVESILPASKYSLCVETMCHTLDVHPSAGCKVIQNINERQKAKTHGLFSIILFIPEKSLFVPCRQLLLFCRTLRLNLSGARHLFKQPFSSIKFVICLNGLFCSLSSPASVY